MPSIAKAAEDAIKRKPFLQEALAKGIINYGSLAEMMMPDIQKELKEEVKQPAVMMALRRLQRKLEKQPIAHIEFNEESNIMARDGLVEVTVDKSKGTLDKIKTLFEKVDYSKGDFLTVTQGVYEITLIFNKQHLEWIKKAFANEITATIEDLSAITLTRALAFTETPGFFYVVTRALAWENINVDEIVSTSKELTLIVKSDDVPYAFNVLKKLVNE